ncbi:MAG TPA: polymorphic toxin-type HINT domain-containing protein, partial [Micromonosporaceae bacterium]
RGPTEAAVSTLETTQNHPFWDVAADEWVDAADLVPGRSVVTSPTGELQLVVAVDNYTGAAEMRDLTVATIHTYYVFAGTTPVLVHNNDDDDAPKFCQLPLFVFKDGEASSAAERAASVGGNMSFQPVPRSLREAMIQAHIDATPPGQIPVFTCWRCGHSTTNPANIHIGHVNVPRSRGGNHNPVNLCFEGAACNLSAQDRGSVTPGMSCAERGGCGAPYGRYD